MIVASNLSATIRKRRILSGVSFSARGGEFIALVGPNGAGKTTLLKHLNGLLKPTEGSLTVCGQDTRKAKTATLARQVGFLFQNPDQQILCQTVREEIEFGLRHCGIAEAEWESRVAASASLVDLADKLDADPFLLTRSKRQRVALASVLATGPAVLVLDEPTSAQDEAETTRIMRIARDLTRDGRTVILVSHDMDLVAKYASRVLLLIDGRLEADCTPEELFARADLLERANLVAPGIYRLARALGYPAGNGHRNDLGTARRDADPSANHVTVGALANFVQERVAKETV